MYERKAFSRIQPEWYTIHETINGNQLDRRYSLQIESDTLDAILDEYKVDFVKIDIEGAEIEALKGATNTLKQLRKIIIEIHENNFDKVKDILRYHGFKIETITNKIVKSEGFVIGRKNLH